MMQTDTGGHAPMQIADALRKGLGRAFELVNVENHVQYREYILDACIHNYVYDPMSEEDRALWLFKLLEHIDGTSFYKDDILAALAQAVNPNDRRQLVRLTAKLALRDTDALVALFHQVVAQFAPYGEQVLVNLLLAIAQRNQHANTQQAIDEYLRERKASLSESAVQLDSAFLARICQQEDTSEVVQILLTWMDESSYLRTEETIIEEWVEDADAYDQEQSDSEAQRLLADQISDRLSPALLGLRRYITDEMLHDRDLFAEWGRSIASEEDRATAFGWFMSEERPDVQTRYLWIFRYVPMPRVDYKVLCLAGMGDSVTLRAAATRALSHMVDDKIRDLAFTLLKTMPEPHAYDAVRLFAKNYQSEDAIYIVRALEPPEDLDQSYALCEDILHLGAKWDDTELSNLLLWAYENTPSSNTRFEIVRLLHDREVDLPHLFAEARLDCDSGTRMFANSALELAEG